MQACYAKSHAAHTQNAKDVKQEVAKMPHAIDAFESNSMLWVAHPLVKQLCEAFLQDAGRRSVRAVALGHWRGVSSSMSSMESRHASASATRAMLVSGMEGGQD